MIKNVKYAVFAIPAIALIALCLSLAGCNSGTPTTGTDTSTGTSTGTDAATITKVSGLIKMGTSTAVSMGFVAIPDSAEATSIATLTENTLDTSILPILNGDDAGVAAGLQQILSLNAFNDPSLAKAKLIMQAAIPLLQAYLPADVLSGQTNKIPPDIKAYLLAFFQGARDGCANYLPATAGRAERSMDFAALRTGLSAKAVLPKAMNKGPVKAPEKTAK